MVIFQKMDHCIQVMQKKVHHLLDPDSDFWYSKLANSFIIATIVLNIIAVILESESGIRQEFRLLFDNVEYFSLIVFTLEYLLRFWSAPANPQFRGMSAAQARWAYTTSFFGLIDLVAIVPFFFSFFIPNTETLRILRLFRIFKLMRYNAAMNTLLTVIKEEAKDLISVIFLLAILLLLASSGIYLFEHEAQPEHFGSILQSMWWGIVTISTVGYGENVPATVPGRIFAGLIMVLGIGLVALPAGILASAFSEQLGRHKVRYRNAVQEILSRGDDITDDDRHVLKSVQNQCNLSEQDARTIFKEVETTLAQEQKAKEQDKKQAAAMAHMANALVKSKNNLTAEDVSAVVQAAQTTAQTIEQSSAAQNPLAYCKQCGSKVAATDKFCGHCGAALKTAVVADNSASAAKTDNTNNNEPSA